VELGLAGCEVRVGAALGSNRSIGPGRQLGLKVAVNWPSPGDQMIEFRTLGTVSLLGADGSELQSVLVQPKRIALLAYLAVASRKGFVRRDPLLGLFWPEHEEARARASLRQALYELRQELGQDALVTRGHDEVGLSAEVFWCDVAAFEAALGDGDPKRAVELHKGPFLAGFSLRGSVEFDQWMEGERDRLARAYAGALEQLAGAAGERRDDLQAAEWWRELVEHDPYATRSVLRLMEALERAGDRAGALEQADRHAARLVAELDAQPSPDVMAFAERLRRRPVGFEACEPLDRLRRALSGRYTVEREIGRGGMAVVYLAHDLKHDRKVAVKVLRPELAAALGAERFLREIRITANLTHPHILPLLDSGSVDAPPSDRPTVRPSDQPNARPPVRPSAFLFYVMPYIEGETLRDRLNREGQLPLDETLQITREVAAALSYAHSRDVVHRDIKPENVLLLAGEAVVADFGIARAITEAGGEGLTETGISIGTPAYMSPEQASGEHHLDGRSDVYSLGCVLYEMLAGEPPYTGPTAQAILAKKLNEPTPRISVVRETVPELVEAALTKALAKAPVDRFGTVEQFAEALSAERVSAAAPQKPAKRSLPLRVALFAVAAVLVAVAIAFGVLSGGGGLEGPPRLAVLPFENLGVPDDEYFTDGITEEITNRLARISGLIVIARSSALQYKGTNKNARQIAEELGADYLLQGTVHLSKPPSGESWVVVNPQLIRGSDEAQLWAESFGGPLRWVLTIHAGIAEQVAAGMNVVLLPEETETIGVQPTENMQAYDVYLRGLEYYERGNAGHDWEPHLLALEMFDSAAVLDPDFVLAHVMRFFAHRGVCDYDLNVQPHMFGAPRRALAKEALDEAVRLDPEHVEVQKALAEYYRWAGDMQKFAEHAEAVIRQQPNDPWSILWLATFQSWRGERDSAEATLLRAGELDPRSIETASRIRDWFARARKHEAELSYANRIVSLAPDMPGPYFYKAWLHLVLGDSAAAHQAMQLGAERVGLVNLLVTTARDNNGYRIFRIFDEYAEVMRGLTQETFGGDTASYLLGKVGAYYTDPGRAKLYIDSLAVFVEKMLASSSEMGDWLRACLAQSHAVNGRMEAARREAEMARLWHRSHPSPKGTNMFLAEAYVLMGTPDAAVEEFREILPWHVDFNLEILRFDPFWESVRDRPAFRELMEGGN